MHSVLTTTIAMLFITALPASAEEGHEGHDHAKHDQKEEKAKSPHGGRVMEVGEHHVEFYSTPERKIEVYFYDHDMKPVKLADAEVQVVAQAPDGSEKYTLTLKGDVFTADQVLPAGDKFNIVLRTKANSESSFQNTRFVFDPSICSGCKLGEYACICEGHDH